MKKYVRFAFPLVLLIVASPLLLVYTLELPLYYGFAAMGLILLSNVIWILYTIRIKDQLRAYSRELDQVIRTDFFDNGEPGESFQMDRLHAYFKDATAFINKIGEGELQVEYPGTKENVKGLNDVNLTGAILKMKSKLVAMAEAERQRNWVTSGLAAFSAIVRNQQKAFEDILQEFMASAVNYTGANQGAIFIARGTAENVRLELKACYAYNRRKFIEKTIAPGEGIVGQAYLEGGLIYLTEVPEDYIRITSGLGEAMPRSVVLVPLKYNGEVEGILEVASFQPWEKYQLDFLLQIGEILGSASTHIKSVAETKRLLEASQLQAVQLSAQEEELRQNMEELQATQDELHRQLIETKQVNGELDARVAALNTSTIVSESDLYGTILFVNDKFLEVTQYSREELIGKPHKLIRHPDMPSAVFKSMWATIKAGKVFRGIVKNRKKDGTHYWVDAVISPVLDNEGKPIKYIGVRYVIEDEEQAEKLFNTVNRDLQARHSETDAITRNGPWRREDD